jgi:hypothetical protein
MNIQGTVFLLASAACGLQAFLGSTNMTAVGRHLQQVAYGKMLLSDDVGVNGA